MARRYPVDVARFGNALRAIVMLDVEAAGHDVADVLDLSAVRPHDGLDALRPTPAWLERVAVELTPAMFTSSTVVLSGVRVSSGPATTNIADVPPATFPSPVRRLAADPDVWSPRQH